MTTIDHFIDRWAGISGGERANYQLFAIDLAEVLELPKPERATGDTTTDTYCFEQPVRFQHGDGSTTSGFIDLYRRGCFVLEAKDLESSATPGYDSAVAGAQPG